jgi:ribosomal protein S18 acetylase RimI-like enzyme
MRLEPKSAVDVTRYLDASWRNYAREVATELGIPIEEARTRTGRQRAAILPEGAATPGHEFYDLVEQTPVGSLWVGEHEGDLYVFDIVVDESARGRGHGTAALRLVEDLARARGAGAVALSVFAHNTDAIRLYERLGYEVVIQDKGGQRMRKPLRE